MNKTKFHRLIISLFFLCFFTSLRSTKPAETRYKLASAVVHVGNAFSGHFMTYRRGPSKPNEPLTKNWLCVSDESVYTAVLADVLLQKAYMLYYQRDWWADSDLFLQSQIQETVRLLTFDFHEWDWIGKKFVTMINWFYHWAKYEPRHLKKKKQREKKMLRCYIGVNSVLILIMSWID